MKVIHKPAKVWYLELKPQNIKGADSSDFSIKKIFPVDVNNYKNIYKEVGGPWDWANRLAMTDDKLQAILKDEKNEIYYCYYKGTFAGYFEIDTHTNDIELVYFGLSPKFIGKGLGKQMMQSVISKANQANAPRLWLHTCEFDAPQALKFYLKSGFSIYNERIEDQTIIQFNKK